jgi:FixJ family two-component response regulator
MHTKKNDRTEPVRSRFDLLSSRQREVCRLIITGATNPQIATSLGVSVNTVKVHRAEVFRRMGCSSILQLARNLDLLGELPVVKPCTHDHALAFCMAHTPLSVLILDDDNAQRDALIAGLEALGHIAAGMHSRDDLLGSIAACNPDIVLFNIDNGAALWNGISSALRRRIAHECGIVMVGQRGSRDSHIQNLRNGADAFLNEPLDLEELDAVMQNIKRRLLCAGRHP